ncbi:unnamed protein product [Durusdinium trenchii]|uniref:TIR domain-containing protein n=1 Tax=Durusdinium trenchii TaxID=1381693 RepID=A0ABP0HIK2_9DINO
MRRKKREGIEAITAYLWHSKRLFVILSDVYLQRIWTVFEMSAFLAAKTSNTRMGGNRSGRNLFDFQKEGGANVIVQPVALASLVPTCFVFQWVRALGDYARYNLTQWGRNGIDTDLIVALVFSVLALLQITSLVLILQRWGRTRANLKHQVETFSFNEAKCHHEPDRKQISLAVKYLAERSRLVSSEVSLQEAQEALEGHARQMVWPVMAGALSHAGIPFWDAWVIGVPVAAVALDDISVDIASGFGVNFVGLLARLVAVLNFPIVLALISISASTQSSCCWWMVGTILRVFFVTAFTSTRGWMNAQVEEYAKGQGIPRLGLLLSLVFLVQILVLWCSYGDGVKRMRRCIRRCCSRDS